MKASRLLSILMLLQARQRMSAPALAQTLEVSERTILRDIDELSAAGVPIWGARGRQGGFELRAGWSTQLTGMTEPEVNALFLAGLPGPATELGLGAAAASARLKVIAGLPGPWREQASQIAERLHIDPVDWYRSTETPALLREVAEAVWRACRIRMRYQSWERQSTREVNPLGLVLKAGAWYLVGQSSRSGRIASYRLANVLELELTTQVFARPRTFNLADYWSASITRFETELQRNQAHVRASPRAMTWIANLRIRSVPAAPADADGWHALLVPIESVDQAARQLLAFGAEIEVLEPPELRARIAEFAKASWDRHRLS